MSKNKKILIFSVAAIILTIVAIIIIILTGKRETYRFIEVDRYNGSVTLERNGTKPELFEGLHLITDDMVSTGDASDILLLADTDKHILAEENTGFSIKAEGNEAKGRIAVNLMYGSSLITIDNKLPDGSEFVVNTPNAALSVRGTVFLVSYDPETETTIVVVTKGVVEVVSADGAQTIEAGGSCVVSGNASYETDVTTIAETTISPIMTTVNEFEDPLAAGRFNLKTDETESGLRYHVYVPSGFTVSEPFLGSCLRELQYDELTSVMIHREGYETSPIFIDGFKYMSGMMEDIKSGSFTGYADLNEDGQLGAGGPSYKTTVYFNTIDTYKCRINDTDTADVYIVKSTYESRRTLADYIIFIDMITDSESNEEVHPAANAILGEYLENLLSEEHPDINSLARAIFPPA